MEWLSTEIEEGQAELDEGKGIPPTGLEGSRSQMKFIAWAATTGAAVIDFLSTEQAWTRGLHSIVFS